MNHGGYLPPTILNILAAQKSSKYCLECLQYLHETCEFSLTNFSINNSVCDTFFEKGDFECFQYCIDNGCSSRLLDTALWKNKVKCINYYSEKMGKQVMQDEL
jgi:hypothetical protein